MTLKIETAPAPKPVRAPNPFDDVFPTPEGEARVVTMPGTFAEKGGDDNAAEIRKVIKQAREAANHKGYSVKVTRESVGTDKSPKTKLIFVTRTLIKRPRKDKG